MTHPVDPREGLRKGQVRDRAAAVRAVAADGDWEDVPLLVELASGDKSPSVRLYAAAGAADIAAAHRGAGGQPALSRDQQKQIFEWLKAVDPSVNPGLLLMLAASSAPRHLDRLGRLLRDPRSGVRLGAVAAVRRLALSGASVDEAHIPEAIASWIASGKLQPDVMLELGRLAGEAGYTDFEGPLRKVSVAGRPHAEVVQEAMARLHARTQASTWEGVWACEGSDVLQPAEGEIIEWFVLAEGAAFRPGKPAEDVHLTGRIGEVPARMVWAPRGRDRGIQQAIQVQGFTFWKVEGKALTGFVEQQLDRVALLGPAARPILDWLDDLDGSLSQRAAAIACWQLGRLDEARQRLDGLTSHKKPRNDLFWWLGRVAADQKDPDTARSALTRFLDKAGKKAAYRTEAEALLASL